MILPSIPARRLVAAGLGLVLAAALAGAAAMAQPAAQTVTISNFTFDPMTVSIPAGAQVTWVNGDDVPHTVRAADGAFHSRPIDTGESFTMTFAKPGVYPYFCSLHPRMVGKVVVRQP